MTDAGRQFREKCEPHLPATLIIVDMLRPPGAVPLFSDDKVSNLDDIYRHLGGHWQWHKLRELEKVPAAAWRALQPPRSIATPRATRRATRRGEGEAADMKKFRSAPIRGPVADSQDSTLNSQLSAMIIDLPRFIAAERPAWTELEQLLDRLDRDPGYSLTVEQAKHFHFSIRKSPRTLPHRHFFQRAGLRSYLESLVARAYGEIHETREHGRGSGFSRGSRAIFRASFANTGTRFCFRSQ
jgi:hypothetical protein